MKTIFTSILAIMMFSISFAEGDSTNTLQASANIINESVQGSNDGSIDLSISGGTSPYTFEWNTGDTIEDINDLAAGTYDVTISDADSGSVTYSYDVLIEQAQDDSTSGDSTGTDPCQDFYGEVYVINSSNGNNDGSIDLVVNGGTTPYSYSWNTGSSSEDIHNLTPGHYTVDVTDDNACKFSISTYVYEESGDSTQSNDPIDTIESNPIDTCFNVAIDHATINGFELLENTMSISWLVFDENNNLLGNFIVKYNFSNDSSGIYNIVVEFECGRASQTSFSQKLYINRGIVANVTSVLENIQVSSIYPNPVKNRAFIQIEAQQASQAQLSIISITGQVISIKQIDLNTGHNTINLNTSSLEQGIYILKLTQNNKITIKQFVK